MKRSLILSAAALAAFFLSAWSGSAEAQYSDQYRRPTASPEYFAFEFGVGQYRPDVGNGAFNTIFDGDYGPALRLELDVLPLRIPYVGRVGIGLQAGWSRHSARACTDSTCSQRTDESVDMRIWPISTMGVLRVDVLARSLSIPVILTGKIGLDTVIYDINAGARDEASGVSLGLRWGAQIALELDFINMRRARALDDEWGINHTNLFFEIFGSTANSKLDVGTNLSWVVGLGMPF